jgi:hypothetical protein
LFLKFTPTKEATSPLRSSQRDGSMGNICYYSFVTYLSLFFSTTYKRYLLQSSDAPENYGFARWVDPPPIDPYEDYINYLHDRIFDLEREVSSGDKDEEDDTDSNGTGSHEALCSDPYCNCPCHKKKGPPPPPPIMGGYSRKGQHNLICGNTTRINLCYSHGTSMCFYLF